MAYPTCESCHKNVATVTVIEIQPRSAGKEEAHAPATSQQYLCEICAQSKNLPHVPVAQKTLGDIWKLLQATGQSTQQGEELTCPQCGMTREELRTRGRIGCAKDYEVFARDIGEILERVHGSRQHVGRIPGLSAAELDRMQAITSLKRELDTAIREEAYESAARIRDELQSLDETV
jgi:protein arginine kinase activator